MYISLAEDINNTSKNNSWVFYILAKTNYKIPVTANFNVGASSKQFRSV